LALTKSADQDAEVVTEILEKLREMSIDVQYELAGITSPKRALSRYFAKVDKKAEAKEVMKSEVKINLELLSDDDSENDWQGYQGLATCLMFTGEDDHARAAWSLITPNELDGKLPDPAEHACLTNGTDTAESARETINDGSQTAETNATLSSEETSSKELTTSGADTQADEDEIVKHFAGPM
jgi:hypothetical protein